MAAGVYASLQSKSKHCRLVANRALKAARSVDKTAQFLLTQAEDTENPLTIDLGALNTEFSMTQMKAYMEGLYIPANPPVTLGAKVQVRFHLSHSIPRDEFVQKFLDAYPQTNPHDASLEDIMVDPIQHPKVVMVGVLCRSNTRSNNLAFYQALMQESIPPKYGHLELRVDHQTVGTQNSVDAQRRSNSFRGFQQKEEISSLVVLANPSQIEEAERFFLEHWDPRRPVAELVAYRHYIPVLSLDSPTAFSTQERVETYTRLMHLQLSYQRQSTFIPNTAIQDLTDHRVGPNDLNCMEFVMSLVSQDDPNQPIFQAIDPSVNNTDILMTHDPRQSHNAKMLNATLPLIARRKFPADPHTGIYPTDAWFFPEAVEKALDTFIQDPDTGEWMDANTQRQNMIKLYTDKLIEGDQELEDILEGIADERHDPKAIAPIYNIIENIEFLDFARVDMAGKFERMSVAGSLQDSNMDDRSEAPSMGNSSVGSRSKAASIGDSSVGSRSEVLSLSDASDEEDKKPAAKPRTSPPSDRQRRPQLTIRLPLKKNTALPTPRPVLPEGSDPITGAEYSDEEYSVTERIAEFAKEGIPLNPEYHSTNFKTLKNPRAIWMQDVVQGEEDLYYGIPLSEVKFYAHERRTKGNTPNPHHTAHCQARYCQYPDIQPIPSCSNPECGLCIHAGCAVAAPWWVKGDDLQLTCSPDCKRELLRQGTYINHEPTIARNLITRATNRMDRIPQEFMEELHQRYITKFPQAKQLDNLRNKLQQRMFRRLRREQLNWPSAGDDWIYQPPEVLFRELPLTSDEEEDDRIWEDDLAAFPSESPHNKAQGDEEETT
jgi:hypothetical protein